MTGSTMVSRHGSALRQAPGIIVVVALVFALGLRFGVTLGILPRVGTYADIPLVWGAFVMAILVHRGVYGPARVLCVWIGAFAFAVFVSWAVHPSELIRPLLFLMLMGEPFAAVAALWVAPPSLWTRRVIGFTAVGLLAVQIPVAAAQFVLGTGDDRVQGTLSGAFAGAHVLGGVCLVGAAWLFLRREGSANWRLPLAVGLLVIPLISDAKQVLLASPALLLGVPFRRRWRIWMASLVVVGLLAFIALAALPGSGYARDVVRATFSSDGGKAIAGRIVMRELTEDVGSILFGKGPATTVSRAAFLTIEGFVREDSPLRRLGLAPSPITQEVFSATLSVGGAYSSFQSGVSSGLGVLGDLGLFGSIAYLGMFGTVFVAVRRLDTRESIAIAGSWAVFFVLGFAFDWWEQPPMGVLLATLSGLALTGEPGVIATDEKRVADVDLEPSPVGPGPD